MIWRNIFMKKDLNRKSQEPYLFLLPSGGRLTRDRLEKRMKTLCNKADFSGGWHQFRRGFATNLADRGAPLHLLRIVLGHSDIQTTMSYVNPDLNEILERQKNL